MANSRDMRRNETRRNQRAAAEAGIPHPRGLARSIAKAYCRQNGMPERECGKVFRELAKSLPRTGRKRLPRRVLNKT